MFVIHVGGNLVKEIIKNYQNGEIKMIVMKLWINLLVIFAGIFRFWALKITVKSLKTEIIEKEIRYPEYIIRDIIYYEERNRLSRLMIRNPKIIYFYNLVLYSIMMFFCNYLFFTSIDFFWLMVVFFAVLINFLAIFMDFLYDFILIFKDKKNQI